MTPSFRIVPADRTAPLPGGRPEPAALDLAVIVPIMNEVGTIEQLAERILAVCREHALNLREILFVDDGSTDGSWKVIGELAERHEQVRGLRLRRNFGKALALDTGIRSCTAAVIVTMDGDLQDDPAELPKFMAEIAAGMDVVSGWKQVRHDPSHKTLPSKLFNFITAKVSGVPLHDFNCGFKAYRREVFEDMRLYGELHRFVPMLAHGQGFVVGELVVTHHPRRHGRSKYGFTRLWRGALDLLTVLTISRYSQRPGHLFGGAGSLIALAGFLILLYLTSLKAFTGALIGHRPLLQLGMLLLIVGVQTVLFGMLAELINARTRPADTRNLIRARTDTPP
ncbi:MAG TPA: glycosyltransferase family 2 protein [Geminicoccus sp.]|uniref:glycosyltransferase family 2 protein n=1 Tax=Geminicoccus sp. TaxID=2024832 RepID=UPI002E364E47|nr:glycosyltransferase family 2 protein [Geminicoccus sp.]HEX2526198.1 glycosyltransferase family 2 protein [Geminicoccus sp.]